MRVGVIDFFCGCGGASHGFREAAVPGTTVDIVAGIDIDPHSCKTFERMIGALAHQVDVRDLLEDRARLDEMVSGWGLDRFDKLVLIGCSPCQGFAAHRRTVDSVDARRSLFVVFTELVAAIQPDAVFIENVPDLFSGRHWPYYVEGRRILESAGFTVKGAIYNLAGFGLPQERFRAVVMCMRRDFVLPQPELEPQQYRSVRETISRLRPLTAGGCDPSDPMHIVSRHRPETVAILAQVPPDGGNRPVGVGPKCLDRARERHGGYTDVYGRLAWDRPALTITARCRTPSCGRFAHPEQNRGLSVREAALLQGFPRDYVFEGPFDDKYKQIGNAVPPLVAKRLAHHLISKLVGVEEPDAVGYREIVKAVGPGFAIQINGIKQRRKKALQLFPS